MRKGSEEADLFRLRPTRPAIRSGEANAWSTALTTVFRYTAMTARRTRASRRPAPQPKFNQRCAVRITYAKNKLAGQWRAHGHYILRAGAASDAFASAGTIANAETLGRWQAQGDERLWKFIVSPEFGERVEFQLLIAKLTERMERDLGTKLEWIAVSHFNTEHPHVHIVMRGMRADGTALNLPKDYIKCGIRQIAEDLCTRQLGYRTEQDRFEAEQREINQTRITSLDKVIGRSAPEESNERFRCDLGTLSVKGERRAHVRARLAFLRKAGLAEPVGVSVWSVRSDFQTVLKSMQQVADRQRTLAAHRTLVSDPNLPVVLTDLKTIGSLQGRILGYGEDEQNFSKPYMLIEESGTRVHLIYQDPRIQAARSRGQLRVGSFVRLRPYGQQGARLSIQEEAGERRSDKTKSVQDMSEQHR